MKEKQTLTEKALIDLTMKKRGPITEEEKQLSLEIEQIEKEGLIVEIPKEHS